MAVFLPGRILGGHDHVASEGTFQRTVAHGDLSAVAAREIRSGMADVLRRRPRALIDCRLPRWLACRSRRLHSLVGVVHSPSPIAALFMARFRVVVVSPCAR